MKTLISIFLLTMALSGSGREAQTEPKSIVCFDGDRVYLEGESWTCKDRCNTCKCVDGEIASTKMFCEKK